MSGDEQVSNGGDAVPTVPGVGGVAGAGQPVTEPVDGESVATEPAGVGVLFGDVVRDPVGPGRVLAQRYELGHRLGSGGMAEVYAAVDRRLGRTVAVKVLRPSLGRDDSVRARFAREAHSAASLNHPAVVAVHDTGDDAGE
ncbi:MAG: hypothetical protein FWE61_08500, partial [Micrococcales bacterium]|nr:hypothetical protein [Micrococcales bacterium]